MDEFNLDMFIDFTLIWTITTQHCGVEINHVKSFFFFDGKPVIHGVRHPILANREFFQFDEFFEQFCPSICAGPVAYRKGVFTNDRAAGTSVKFERDVTSGVRGARARNGVVAVFEPACTRFAHPAGDETRPSPRTFRTLRT